MFAGTGEAPGPGGERRRRDLFVVSMVSGERLNIETIEAGRLDDLDNLHTWHKPHGHRKHDLSNGEFFLNRAPECVGHRLNYTSGRPQGG